MGFLLLLILLPGAAYWVLAWLAARRHLSPVAPKGTFTPRVSILKPLHGADRRSYARFATFCRQDYPDYEILFGVQSANDPAAAVVEKLRADFPLVPIRLFVAPVTGANPKVSTLQKLAAEAAGEILSLSDADVSVEGDYLRAVVAPLQDPSIGVVTCPYRGAVTAGNWVAQLAALHMNATFLPSAIFANTALGMRVGLGASMTVRAPDLRGIGGFASIMNFLADDYQLADKIADAGKRICLSNHVVTCEHGRMRFGEQWDREVRWARGIRVTRPREYPGLLVTFLTPLALILACALAAFDHWIAGLAGLGFALLLRWAMCWSMLRRLKTDRIFAAMLWLPVRDVLSLAVWIVGLAGRRVVWCGQRFIIHSAGQIEPEQHRPRVL
jgi:ceramide glucosyltransferase